MSRDLKDTGTDKIISRLYIDDMVTVFNWKVVVLMKKIIGILRSIED